MSPVTVSRAESTHDVNVEDPVSTKHEEISPPPKISAYYSLVFPNFTYYLQTLNVTIGRRCTPSVATSSLDSAPVDVDLGPLKSVSRLHAKIEYEEDEERFVLVVIGRNGAWVDGVWSGSGSRVALSERSQIQIASRTFQFVLPPPSPPENSPSPSSQSSSANRPRSPSVDITSISPPSSLPSRSPPAASLPIVPKIPPQIKPQPHSDLQLPNSNNIGKLKTNAKKRKKTEAELAARPKPDVMPPKPQFTYAQLCYRAIKSYGGKATLQDICQWMMENFDWYRYNEGAGWENSVRHNLSSSRAFKKMERCAGERGKGFFWSVDEKYEHTFEEQEAKAQSLAASGGKVEGKTTKKKDKGASLLEPPLKRSVKGDLKGALPPPLTSAPLAMKTTTFPHPTTLSDPSHPSNTNFPPNSAVKSEPPQTFPLSASSTQQQAPLPTTISASAVTPVPTSSGETSTPTNQSSTSIPHIPSTVCLPIIVGPAPTQPTPTTSSAPTSTTRDPIVLHNNCLYLTPDIFSHLAPEQLKELEALGAHKAVEILRGYLVLFLKERIRTEGSRSRGRGRPKRGGRVGVTKGGKDGAAVGPPGISVTVKAEGKDLPVVGPFTNAPLPPRNVQPAQTHEAGGQREQGSHPAASTPALVDISPPVPVPVTEQGQESLEDPPSPIIIVDDFESADEGPATKRRRLDVPLIGSVHG